MKKTRLLYSATILGVMLISFSGCKKFLDQVPNDRETIEQVFQKKGPSERYLANIYSYVDNIAYSWADFPWLTNADEADATWSKYATYQLNRGNMSAGNVLFDRWGTYYNAIRSATYFMNHIDGNQEILSLNGQQLIDQYKAEARFLRAYYYFLLMKQFGPVVLVGETEVAPDASSEEMSIPRSTWDSCVNYVVSELDKAAATLPLVPSFNGQENDLKYGHATKGMALAVKARLLLYAASPLYNGNTNLVGFTKEEGQPFINPTYDANKWKKAADAAKAVIDLNLYSLYKDPGGDPVKSYQGIFMQAWNSEQIFNRKDNGLSDFDVHSMPRQAGGWNGMAPTQEQVDAYFMTDGKTIVESPLYSESGFTNVNGVSVYNMYINREPRFYASITYHNSIFQGGNMNSPQPINFFVNGPNGKSHPTDWSRTGYLIRKNVAPQTNAGSGGTGQRFNRPLCLFRLGEVYLNYAEALNEYDPGNPDILKYLNLIRERAGVPLYGSVDLPVPASKEAMRDRIWQERRVELAFESLRYFDIRRWMIAPQVMGDLHGMDINKNDNSFFTRVVAVTHIFRNPASYWFPISQYQLDRNRNLIQNPGW